jgi:hypothetical protein
MDVHAKAAELGWTISVDDASAPFVYSLQPEGSRRIDGPRSDKHFAISREDLEALLLTLEAGQPTDRWRQPH